MRPKGRVRHTAAVYDDKFFVVGGVGKSSLTASPATSSFEEGEEEEDVVDPNNP